MSRVTRATPPSVGGIEYPPGSDLPTALLAITARGTWNLVASRSGLSEPPPGLVSAFAEMIYGLTFGREYGEPEA